MGWFWADTTHAAPLASHPQPRTNASPPPGCPMHNSNPPPSTLTQPAQPSTPYPSIPPPTSTARTTIQPPSISALNPLNAMPASTANTRSAAQQSVALPQSREASTIPRGDGPGTWQYPSAQQMYNALLRKGYTDTPAEHVEAMVAVHNFLNEGAWDEIRTWEAVFGRGVARGWEVCKRGETNLTRERGGEVEEPKLLRFLGRPETLTPKARVLGALARVWPARFADNPPFDRHDWYVQRVTPGGTREVRYVIDYYAGPPEPTGEPVFFLDVRPAIDGPGAALERTLRWGGDVWYRASGGSAREELQRVGR